MPLHDDAQAFLAVRNAFRTAIANALAAPVTVGETVPPEAPGDDDCTVEPREDRAGACAGLQERLAQVTPIEQQRAAGGWPDSDSLYEDLLKVLDGQPIEIGGDEDVAASMELVIQLMRQANVLESYRKMLLHKKQRWCHFLSSWCECMKGEQASQDELEQLMQNIPVDNQTTSTSADPAD